MPHGSAQQGHNWYGGPSAGGERRLRGADVDHHVKCILRERAIHALHHALESSTDACFGVAAM